MKYTKPEIEVVELNTVDVIATSETGDFVPGNNQPGWLPRSESEKSYYEN